MSTLAPSRTPADVAVGEELPELAIPITRTLVVATAIASRDYQDVHHDPSLAVERGSKDVFMNILTSNAMVERYAKQWAGPAAVVRKIRIRLGAPNHPGDTMTMRGSVASMTGALVELAVTGTNSIGAHVSGSVVLEVPAGVRHE